MLSEFKSANVSALTSANKLLRDVGDGFGAVVGENIDKKAVGDGIGDAVGDVVGEMFAEPITYILPL